MALKTQTRRGLRAIQSCLETTVPTPMLADVGRNDPVAWASLAMLEMRVSLARGQTYYARQFAHLLSAAAEAGLAVDSYSRREIQGLINAIDSVLTARHYLALHQLEHAAQSPQRTVQWAAEIWRARSLSAAGQLTNACEAALQAIELAEDLPPDATAFATCVEAELAAEVGQAGLALQRVSRVASQFADQGELRLVSFARLSQANIVTRTRGQQAGQAAAEEAYRTDVGWTGPVMWLARAALAHGDMERARNLLNVVPNPTADVYWLLKALAVVERRNFPVDAVVRDLALAETPPSETFVEQLFDLLSDYRLYSPARETLAWKLLLMGQPEGAKTQLRTMVLYSADSQAIAALRFGLQTYQENQARKVEPAQLQATEDRGADGSTAQPPEPPVARDRFTRPTAKVAAASGRNESSEPQGEARGSFVGQISLFGVPDLIQFFCSSRKTGVIAFSGQRGDARIRVHEGELHWAVPPTHSTIGEFLRDTQVISGEQLDLMAKHQADQFDLLLAGGGDTAKKLRSALHKGLHDTLRELVEWADGWFMFDVIEGGSDPRPELLFNAQGILLDVLRELDEAQR